MAIGTILRAVGLRDPIVSVMNRFSPDARARRHLDRSMRLFERRYEDYWRGIVPNRAATPRTDLFDAVAKDGFALVPGYLSAERLAAIREEVFAVPGFADGSYAGPMPFTNKPTDGLCSLGLTRDMPLSFAATAGNEELFGVARALFGASTRLTASAVLNKYNKDVVDSSEVPHWDDWRVRFKAFIYLTDVGPENAPTIYIKGSVNAVPWRLEKDFASVYMPLASTGGSWWPVEQLGLEKVVCTGKAGTLLLFDALGLHAGSRLTGDPRVMLMNMYTTHLEFGHRVY
jgi:hypothetical protein